MDFFIDTANLNQIQEAYDVGILDGVTTNPTLMAAEGIMGQENTVAHYKAICNIVRNNVSAEVISTDYQGMLKEARTLAKISDKIIIKIPLIKEGIKVIKELSNEGIRTNCTLAFSAGQAILAAKVGANYISPFIGRLDDISHSGANLIEQIRHIYDNYGYSTKILAASIRHVSHVVQCAEIGTDVITAPFKVIMGLFEHPLTDIGLKKFLEDYNKIAPNTNS